MDFTNYCFKITYATDTLASFTNLSTGRGYGTAFNSKSRGYVLGGNGAGGGALRSDIIGLRFDTEAHIAVSAALNSAWDNSGAFSSENSGLSIGNSGTYGSAQSWLGDFNFATETNAIRSIARGADPYCACFQKGGGQ